MEERNHYIFAEKYRPKTLDTYIGNDHLKEKVSRYIQSGDIPHLLFYGVAGTGKTTLAKIIVNSIECDHIYINASDERNIDNVRVKIKNFASSVGFKPLKVIVLDEADYQTPVAMAALRNLMETFSKHTRFILTCNYVERIIDPIQSRCQTYKIVPPSKRDVALHLKGILETENIEFDLDDIAVIINSSYHDIRQIINSTQRQVIDNKLSLDVNSIIQNNYKLKLIELLGKKNSFNEIRQLIADNSVSDYSELYRLLYDEVNTFANDRVAECILAIAEGQYRETQSVDHEICFMSTIINILDIMEK